MIATSGSFFYKMHLSTIIPPYLLKNRLLLAVYCYFLRQVRPDQSKILAGEKVVILKPYEVMATEQMAVQEVGATISEITDMLQILAQLDIVGFQHDSGAYRVIFKNLVLPASASGSATKPVTGSDTCTYAEFKADYKEYIKTNMAPRTLENYTYIADEFGNFLGTRMMQDTTAVDLERFKTKLKGTVSDHTINIKIRTLKAAFELAKKWGLISDNPFRLVKPIRIPKQSAASLSKDEFQLLLSAIPEEWFLNIVKFAVLTGLRLGELANLKWSDYNDEKGTITIQSTQEYHVKHGKMRVMPLHQDVISLLRGIQKRDECVFLKGDSTRPSPQFISKKFKAYSRAAGLPEKYHFHSLRATFATWAANSGVSMYTLQNLMGHSSIKVTEGYTSPDLTNLQKELSKISISSK